MNKPIPTQRNMFLEHCKYALGFAAYLAAIGGAVIVVLALAHVIASYNVRNSLPIYTVQECK
jgi:hypothetical protein